MITLLPAREAGLAGGDENVAIIGTGESQPQGLEAILEYNGIFLNDRSTIDKIRLTGIDGFMDADVRDTREMNPQDHGETPFDSFYGGRTMVLEGHVDAFNVKKLRDMQQALRTAFLDISQEFPLIIRTGDIKRDVMIYCKKMATTASKEQQTRFDFRRDFQITLRASDPRFVSYVERAADKAFGWFDDFERSHSGVGPDYTQVGGSGLTTAGSLTPTDLTTKYLYYNGERWSDFDFTLKVGRGVAGGILTHLYKRIDAVNSIEATFKADGSIGLRKWDNAVNSADQGSSGAAVAMSNSTIYWCRLTCNGNVITARRYSVDPFGGTNPAPITTATWTLTGSDATKYGAGAKGESQAALTTPDLFYRWDDWRVEPLSIDHAAFTLRNDGNFSALPVIRVYGPMTTITISNLSTGENAYITGSIPAGDYYDLDTKEKTLKNSAGISKFSQLSVASDMISLRPSIEGDNDITVAAASTSGVTPAIRMLYRHTWM